MLRGASPGERGAGNGGEVSFDLLDPIRGHVSALLSEMQHLPRIGRDPESQLPSWPHFFAIITPSLSLRAVMRILPWNA
jgi:hypothetical protein